MHLCFIGKYPPLVGGVSSRAFWKLGLLSQAGVKVHVVSNALEAKPYQYFLHAPAIDTANITLHYLQSRSALPYIPYANPFVTRLSTVATRVVEQYHCDLIEANYFEPYGIAANLVSGWTNVPYGVQHAGSDIGRLYKSEELCGGYKKSLQQADYLFFSQRFLPLAQESQLGLAKLHEPYRFLPLPEYFNPDVKSLDINDLLKRIKQVSVKEFNSIDIYQYFANKHFDAKLPTIGIYGKASFYKGHMQLIAALGLISKRGLDFNFAMIIQGKQEYLLKIKAAIIQHELEGKVFLLPFIPCWKIPHFIRACTAVCFLENNFPIKQHHPLIPYEILSCAKHLIVTEEIANKMFMPESPMRKYSSIVNLNDGSLLKALQAVITNKKHYQQQALLCYESHFAKRQHSSSYHSEKLVEYYQQLVKFAHQNHRLKKLLICQDTLKESVSQNLQKQITALSQRQAKSFLTRTFELTRQLLPKLETHIDTFLNLLDMFNKDDIKLVKSFNQFMQTKYKQADSFEINPACLDLLNYETNLLELKLSKASVSLFTKATDDIDMLKVAILQSNTATQTFLGNIFPTISQLEKQQHINIDKYIISRQSYILCYSETLDKVQPFAINENTKTLMGYIDGQASLLTMFQRYNREHDLAASQENFQDIIKFLLDHRLILLASPAIVQMSTAKGRSVDVRLNP